MNMAAYIVSTADVGTGPVTTQDEIFFGICVTIIIVLVALILIMEMKKK